MSWNTRLNITPEREGASRYTVSVSLSLVLDLFWPLDQNRWEKGVQVQFPRPPPIANESEFLAMGQFLAFKLAFVVSLKNSFVIIITEAAFRTPKTVPAGIA